MIIEIPYPPTGNHATKHTRTGRHYTSQAAKQYRTTVSVLIYDLRAALHLSCLIRVVAEIYPPDKRRRDLDNVWKTAGDALTQAGVWEDDYQISDLRMRRMDPVSGGKIIVSIEETR